MTDVDPHEVAAQVQQAAEERRARGEYPDDLESHLDRHYHAIVQEGRGDRARRLREETGRLAANTALAWEPVATTSRVPGGSALHRFVASSVERQIAPLLAQLREFTTGVAAVLEVEAEALAELRTHVDALVERAATERERGGDSADLAGITRRLAEIEAALRDVIRTTP